MKIQLLVILILGSALFTIGQTTEVHKVDEHKTIFSVYFAVSHSKINDKQREDILKVVAQLNGKDINIKGYADSIGNIKFNNKLALARVETVEEFIRLKFPMRMIHSSSVGEDPLAKQHSLSEQRRVDIELTTSGKVLQQLEKEKLKSSPPKPIVKKQKITVPPPIKKTPEQEFEEMMNSGDKIVFKNVLFQPGKWDFQYNKTPNELYHLAEMMDTIPSMQIQIAGHVCCEDNKKLSKKRAKTVYSFLKRYGINKSRISYKGYSNYEPRVEELTPADQRKNRRVEIIVLER